LTVLSRVPADPYMLGAKHKEGTMPNGPKGEKRPANVIGNEVKIARIATGEEEDAPEAPTKDEAAASLGRLGGEARARKVTPEQRLEIARKAARPRWSPE
jgi:hypothetical protein